MFRPRSRVGREVRVDRGGRRAGRRSRRAARPGRGGAAPRRRGRQPAATARRSRPRQSVVRELGLGGYTTAAALAERYGDGSAPADDSIPELRTFGHVLVDEAQDLTPMQWRMLARRCPNGSMTIVGDFGQASRPGAATSWDDVLGLLPTPRRAPPGHADGQLPHAGRDHGSRQPPAHGRGIRRRADPVGAPHRVPAAGSPGSTTSSRGRPTRPGPRVDGGRDRRGHRAGRAARARSPSRSPTSVRSPMPPRRSTRRSACSSPTDAKGLEFDHVDRGRAGPARDPGLRRAPPALRDAHPRHPDPDRGPRRGPARGARAIG